MKNERLVSNNSRRGQRGAIGIFAVMTLMITILFVTLVVDTGRLWMQKRQLQSIADIAAIEAAKSLGCAPDIEDVRAAAQSAAVANGFGGTLASTPNTVELGRVVTNAAGIRQFDSSDGSEAVRVVATRSVPASLFAGGLFNEQVLLSAEAVSIANMPIAAFSAGTSTVELNSQDSVLLNSLLSNVLGSNVNLSLVSYKGLADANVTLAQLIAARGDVASVDQLLDLNLTADEFLGMLSEALTATGSAAAGSVQTLANAVTKNTTVKLGDVLNIASTNADGILDVGINALSLINTVVLAANGQNAITLPLAINVGSLINTSTTINVIEKPQIAIGPPAANNGTACTVARTAQVRILSTASVNVLGLAKIDLGLNVAVAQGQAGLQSMDDDGSNTEVVIGTMPGIADVGLTGSSGSGAASISALAGLVKLAEISLNLPLAQPAASELEYDVVRPAQDHLPQAQTTSTQVSSSMANALGQSSALKVKLLGLDLLGIVGKVVEPIVRPLLVTLASSIIDPLLKLLGIQLGVLTVNLQGIQLIQPQPLVI